MESPAQPGKVAAVTTEAAPAPGAASVVTVGGILVNRYRIIARVGAGGMATIYRGWDQALERDVAIKVLHPHLADDPDLLARFRTEARHAAGLLHANIVNVFDQGVADLPWIVMEYVDGPSLRDVLRARGRLSPAEALSVIEPICAGLGRAHAKGLVHRDVKPENVLIGERSTVKVADFGIARAVAVTSHTTTGTLVGSVHYLAPELVDGRGCSPASDQYAVGVLLFELLTGRKPLTADSPMAIALRHTREPLPPPSRFVKGIPRAVDRVVARAAQRDPSRRYRQVGDVAAALREALPGGARPLSLTGEPALPGTGSAEPSDEPTLRLVRGRRRVRWRRRLTWTAVTVALITAAGSFADSVLFPLAAVPQVVGLAEADAAARLGAAGFDVRTRPVAAVSPPAGTVTMQEPAAGDELRRTRDVTLTVSSGPARVEVPAVRGLDEAEARRVLEDAALALRVRPTGVFSDTEPPGTVLGQEPAPGTPLAQGSPVGLSVSLGVEQVVVPDLAGRSRSQAQGLLAAAKLRGEFSRAYRDEQPRPGAVAAQSLRPGTRAHRGSTVKVVVSRGPLTVEVPGLVGTSLGNGRDALEDLGLEVSVVEEPRPRFGPFPAGQFGLVEFLNPVAGTAVRRGDAVTIYTFSAEADADADSG